MRLGSRSAGGRHGGTRTAQALGRLRAAVAVALALAAGCGGEDQRSDPASRAPEPSAAAAEASRALEEAGTFSFDSTYLRIRSDRPDEPEEYASSEGAVDLRDDRGRMDFRLELEGLEGEEPVFAERMMLEWDAERLAARIGGNARSATRDEARESYGLLGRLPDEPAGLVSLLEHVDGDERIGTADVGGEETTGYRFDVDEAAAGRVGVPAEVAPALEAGSEGMELTLEAWLGSDSLPRRLVYVLELEPLRGGDGRQVLPARTIRVIYDLSGFGEDVDVDLSDAP